MRFYHNGAALTPPVIKDEAGNTVVATPPKFWTTSPTGEAVKMFVPCKPGSVCFSYGEHFYTVPPGGWVDIPEPVKAEDVIAVAAHLVPESQWQAAKEETKLTAKEDEEDTILKSSKPAIEATPTKKGRY